MNTASERFSKQIHLDGVVDVRGVLVGTDPYRRWGPIFRWPLALLDGFLSRGMSAKAYFNKRDVVVTDLVRIKEFYREGPFSSMAADRRKMAIVTAIKTDGLDQFLCRVQIDNSTIGPVSAPSGKMSFLEQTRAYLRVTTWRNGRKD